MQSTKSQLLVLLINRDKDCDRLDHMTAEAAKAGFSFERVTAVEGLALPQSLRDEFLDENGQPYAHMFPAEIGCYASHLVCCHRLLESDAPFALVLEDDVELTDRFADVVSASLAAAPTGWDIIRLSSVPATAVLSVASLPGEHRLVKYLRLPKLAGAQLWSRAGAAKFARPRKRVRVVDADLRYGWESGLDMYGVFPPPALQTEAFASTISQPGTSRRKERGGSWQQITLASRLDGMATRVRDLGVAGTLACLAATMRKRLGLGTPAGWPVVTSRNRRSDTNGLR